MPCPRLRHAVGGYRYSPRAMKIGYGRVSTRDQNPGAQRDTLAVSGIGLSGGSCTDLPQTPPFPPTWQAGRSTHVVTRVDGPWGADQVSRKGAMGRSLIEDALDDGGVLG